MEQWDTILAIVASVLTILGIVLSAISAITGSPFHNLLLFAKHNIVRVSRNADFTIEAIKDKSNKRTMHEGSSFSYKYEVPLTVRGATKFTDDTNVWVVLTDAVGGYYLQYPPVHIRIGTWSAGNIRPLEGIRNISFYKVNNYAHDFFMRKANESEWGKFKPLPDGCKEIAFIELR